MSLAKGGQTFASLIRNSRFISLGDFRGAIVTGKVFHTTEEELYVDFGSKFHAVVKKPREETSLYVRGSIVKLKLLDYEITDRFIGSEHMTSLLEADAILQGLVSTPVGCKRTNPEKTAEV